MNKNKWLLVISAVVVSSFMLSSFAAELKVVTEYRYPTSFTVTPITATTAGGAGNSQIVGGIVEPGDFVTRETGTILSVNAMTAAFAINNKALPTKEHKVLHGNTDLMIAATSGDALEVQRLLRRGSSVNARNKFGATALMGASAGGFDDIVKMLLDKRAYVDSSSKNNSTALMYAARNGNTSTVKLLLGRKASVNKKNKDGQSALMYAVDGGHANVIKVLAANKATINGKDRHGTTPLMLASTQNQRDIVVLLTKYGAR